MTIPMDTPPPKVEPKTTGANLKFRLPAGATLYVDGRPAAGAGVERTFYTPALEAGQKYFYDVRAEVVVAGQTVTEEKRVIVSSGSDITESFTKLLAAADAPNAVAAK
jgi:uncharacterized protein (TIGR03000 family)